jgi:polysaccharide pyruvyl transferase WcaK-like protein
VEDAQRFQTRLDRHSHHFWKILSKLELIEKRHRFRVARFLWFSPRIHKFIWGGEVFAPARGWFHGGGNLFFLLLPSLLRHNVTLLGWFSRATRYFDRFVHYMTFKLCLQCVCREKISYKYVVNNIGSADKVVLHQDFAKTVVDSRDLSILPQKELTSITWLLCPYILVNANPYVDIYWLIELVKNEVDHVWVSRIVYFAWDKEDIELFDVLVDSFWQENVTVFDWTQYDVYTTMSVVSHASVVIAIRLHIIATAHRLRVPLRHIVYQEKIEKFFNS